MPLKFYLTRKATFEAAHTLERTVSSEAEAEASRRVHGHSYEVEIGVSGGSIKNGMLLDGEVLSKELDRVREKFDHQFLNSVPGLHSPTIEAISLFIWEMVAPRLSNLDSVSVRRRTVGDSCTLSIR